MSLEFSWNSTYYPLYEQQTFKIEKLGKDVDIWIELKFESCFLIGWPFKVKYLAKRMAIQESIK